MILLADSGSTKTAWVCCDKSTSVSFQTIGLNPYFVSSDVMKHEILSNIPKQISIDSIQRVYFYGSGCGRADIRKQMQETLNGVFLQASVVVETDLYGAAIACYGNQKGVVAILGTGMNVGYWDGKTLETPLPSLGYIFGDAGSGAVLGRNLIKSVFERRLPQNIIDDFMKKYTLTVAEVLERVYKQPRPNTFLATFAPFYSEHIYSNEIQCLLHESYAEFARYYAKPVTERYGVHEISFVGSLAHVFSDILKAELEVYGIEIKTIIASPLMEMEKQIVGTL